jgi:hypothetical protein
LIKKKKKLIAMKKIAVLYVIGILIASTIFTFGLYNYITPDNPGDGSGNGDDIIDDGDGSLSDEVRERWKSYSAQVDSPEIITTDPGIAKTSPGEDLEKLADLEGMQDFTDSSTGTSYGNASEPPRDASQETPDPSSNYDSNDDSLEGGDSEKDAGAGASDGGDTREVEEADLVKVIGDTLYVLNSYRGLITIDISDPADAHIEGTSPVIGYPEEMYVVDFLAIITVRTNYNFWYEYWALDESGLIESPETETGTIGTMIYIVNVEDPAEPVIQKIVELEGFPAESRRVGHVIYQATNTYNWYYYNNDEQETIVSSIDFGDPETVGMKDQVRFKGSSNQVHASPTAFYVAQPKYEYEDEWIPWDNYEYYTEVTYLDISDPDGEIEQKDTFKSPGFLNNKYQMDEYKYMFRMVTHFWTGIGESKLYIFDVSNPNNIDQMGSLLVDDAGSLMATRFAGERAYTIHLPRAIDPLDVLDLSDPTNPKLCDVFEVPGWVTHMEVRGMKIIALGVDDSEGQRNVAVSLFDVSDPYNVEMLDRERLGGDYAYSAANWEPKALTIDDTHNIVIVPFNSYSRTTYKNIAGVQLVQFDLDAGELTLKGEVSNKYTVDRTRVVGDYVLATSFRTLQVIDIDNLNEPEVVKVIDLCINIKDIAKESDFFIQLVQDWYDDTLIIRSVAGADDLEAVDTETLDSYWFKLFELPEGYVLSANVQVDGKQTGKLFSLDVDDNGNILLVELKSLPAGVTFNSYSNYYGYYGGSPGMEDDVFVDEGGEKMTRSEMAAPYYYYDYGTEKFTVIADALVYYHVGEHTYSNWVYNETAGRYFPTPEEKGTDTLYVFDFSNGEAGVTMSSIELEAYTFIEMVSYDDTLYIQHRMSGVDIFEENSYYYYNWYYKNHVMEIDLGNPALPENVNNFNIPGKLVGAGDNVVFTLSDWSDETGNTTLNTLTIGENTASITSAVKIGTEYVNVVMEGSKAYIINRPNDYYYYYYAPRDTSTNGQDLPETTLKIIDFSNPNNPVLETTATFEGYVDIEDLIDGHIFLRDTSQSSIMIYTTDPQNELEFEAMVYVQGGYETLRLYGSTLYIPQGYYGVLEAQL